MLLKSIRKNKYIIKKWDIFIILILIFLSFVPEIIFGIAMGKSYNGTYAEITVSGKLYNKIPLSEHKGEETLEVKTDYGYNMIDIYNDSIKIIDADCKDKICIKSGSISHSGESLICLPHKLMVEVKNYNNQDDNDIILAHWGE